LENKPCAATLSSLKPLPIHQDRSELPIRVLVVDDYEPFRRFVRLRLEPKPSLLVIGEASDGIEAVRKAEELQPDLVVLDIGLPGLNGIEAARHIREVSPESKILVLTQESSAAVMQKVFDLGALGYVVKTHAASELLLAVEAVCEGRQFVSSAISDRDRNYAVEAEVAYNLSSNQDCPSLAPQNNGYNHAVEFYSDDASFVVGFTRFIESSLSAGNAVIVVATAPHQESLLQRFEEHGVNIALAIKQGRYFPLDVVQTLATFMVDDLPDPERFLRVVGGLIAGATPATGGKASRVAICGESASILWAQGKADGAIQVEQLCNQLTKRYEMEILCGFSLSSFYTEEDKEIFQKICSEC
jgi:DNA-binding NarL/FixJ family response regulator